MLPQLVPLILFGIAAGFSPGPNNIVTSHSAFNFGFKKTIPTMLGVISGWTLLSIILVFGAGIIFKKFEELQFIIKILGSVYLIFLAYKISFNKIKLPSQVNRFLGRFVDSMKDANLNRLKRSAILYKVIDASGMSVQQLMADIQKIKKELK